MRLTPGRERISGKGRLLRMVTLNHVHDIYYFAFC